MAFLRFTVSLAGTIWLFTLLSVSRFHRKKTVVCYACFSTVLVALACTWYAIDRESCARMVAFTMYVCFALFAVWMSRESIYLTVYKLAVVFYLMSVFVIGGLEVSILLFDRNLWADVIARILLILLIAFLLKRYVVESVKGFSDYVENEADQFSVAAMIICIVFGIGYILNPTLNREVTPHRLYQILMNFILTGTLQVLIFRFYLHVGREKEYERKNQLIQMNNRLLERQLEILEESVESVRRLRHDIRHHNAVMAEYARRGQREELLQYLKEYDEETNQGMPERICANTAVNNILSAYTRKAEQEGIRVTLDVELGRNLPVPSIDLVAILANAYENAIYACAEVLRQPDGRECFIDWKIKKRKTKLIFSCRNTCRMETELRDGEPKPEFTGGVGVSSIISTARKYDGEYDFQNDNGVFVFRLIMNTEPKAGGKGKKPLGTEER